MIAKCDEWVACVLPSACNIPAGMLYRIYAGTACRVITTSLGGYHVERTKLGELPEVTGDFGSRDAADGGIEGVIADAPAGSILLGSPAQPRKEVFR